MISMKPQLRYVSLLSRHIDSPSPHHDPDFIIAATTSTSANSRTMDDEGDNASRGDNDTTSGDTAPHTHQSLAHA